MKAVFWCQTYGPRRDCVARMLKSWMDCPAYHNPDYQLLVWDNTGGRLAQWLLGVAPKITVLGVPGHGPEGIQYTPKPTIWEYVRKTWNPDFGVQLCDDFVWHNPRDPDVLVRYMERYNCVVGAREGMRCFDNGDAQLGLKVYFVPEGQSLRVDAVHGSCMGLPRQAMDSVGFPTNGPYMPDWYPWGDDIAYGLRVHEQGLEVAALGLASCHEPGPGPRIPQSDDIGRTCEWMYPLLEHSGLQLGLWTEEGPDAPDYQPIEI